MLRVTRKSASDGFVISRRMIMHEDDRVRAARHGAAKSLARMKQAFVQRAARNLVDRQHHVLRVEADHHPHALVIEQSHLLAQQPGDIVRRSSIARDFSLAAGQPRRQCERRL